VRDAGPLLDKLNQLTRADVTTGNRFRAKQFQALQDDLEERIARLAEQENLEAIRPPLDGNEVMAHLGVEPGPIVGEALDELMEVRLDRGPIEKEEAYRLLDEWAAAKGVAGATRERRASSARPTTGRSTRNRNPGRDGR